MDLTLREAGERLHVSHEKVRQMVLEGRFPHAYRKDPNKITSPFYIPLKDVIAFEKSRRGKIFVKGHPHPRRLKAKL